MLRERVCFCVSSSVHGGCLLKEAKLSHCYFVAQALTKQNYIHFQFLLLLLLFKIKFWQKRNLSTYDG